MVGAYTPFEVEAERRQEVLTESMRDIQLVRVTREEAGQDPRRSGAPERRSLGARLATILVSRADQRI